MLSQIRAAFDALDPDYWREIAADAMSEDGADADAIAADLSASIDAALNFAALLPAPFGPLVEAFDDKIIEAILAGVLDKIDSPGDREALADGFKGRRSERKAKRRAKRKAHKVSSMTPGHTE
jgi:hypothetical protein